MVDVVTNDAKNTLWTERYRPTTVDQCILPKSIKDVFKGYVSRKEIPSLLLAGPQGLGKTSIAKALCADLGFDMILVNASNERNIDLLRTTITQYATSVSLNGDFKVVILDEFDGATPILQAALKSAIEDFSKATRFILTANHPNKIIAPLHSRCSVVDFSIKPAEKPELAKQMFLRVCKILDIEGVGYDKKAVVDVVSKYFPDYRRTINELQRYASCTGKIDTDIINFGQDASIAEFIKAMKAKSFKDAKAWITATSGSMSVDVIYKTLYAEMYSYVEPNSIPQLVIDIADYQFRGANCPDPELQLAAFALTCMSNTTFL